MTRMHGAKRPCLLARRLHPRGELQEARLAHAAHQRQARCRTRAALPRRGSWAGVYGVRALRARAAAGCPAEQHVWVASSVAPLHEVGAVLCRAIENGVEARTSCSQCVSAHCVCVLPATKLVVLKRSDNQSVCTQVLDVVLQDSGCEDLTDLHVRTSACFCLTPTGHRSTCAASSLSRTVLRKRELPSLSLDVGVFRAHQHKH